MLKKLIVDANLFSCFISTIERMYWPPKRRALGDNAVVIFTSLAEWSKIRHPCREGNEYVRRLIILALDILPYDGIISHYEKAVFGGVVSHNI